MKTSFNLRRLTPELRYIFAAVVVVPALLQLPVYAQNPGAGDDVGVIIRWLGQNSPTGVNGPDGDAYDKTATQISGKVVRPRSGVQLYDLEVTYDNHQYPLRLRVHPETTKVQLTVALDKPRSCADLYLKRLEQPTLTQTESIKAAFTLGYMIDGRSGENSCDLWPFRAAKARFERYQNAVERSNHLAIPDGVKDALRAVARSGAERRKVAELIAIGERAERLKLASSLQQKVLASLKSGDVAAAYRSSSLLLETSRQPEYSAAVASQITEEALVKQTSDLGERAGISEPALPQEPN